MELDRGERTSYVAIALLLPLLGATLGVNGAALFQILAVENLGLDSREIGLAVGLGAVSIPFQISAARIPLRYARRNLRLFVLLMVGLCGVMGWLVTTPGSAAFVVVTAIVIAVVAELAVSVLFATSFQPLLSVSVDHRFRQRLNTQVRAATGVLMIGLVVLVGALGTGGRIAVIVLIGLVGLALLPAVARLRAPPELSQEADRPGMGSDRERSGEGLLPLYVALGISAIPAWPFFVTYAADTYWPTANLGLIGAALTLGSLATAAAWRPTEDRLMARARISAVVLVACAVALVPIDRPVSGAMAGALVLGVVVVATGATSVVRIALVEIAHRRSTPATSVRILTMLDVVGSTVMQVGFLAAGYLISASIDSSWVIDPYQFSLIVAPVLLLGALVRVAEGA